MKQEQRQTAILMLLALAATIGATVAGLKFIENRQRQEAFSSYSTGEDGLYGAYQLLTKAFPGKVHRETAPLAALLKNNSIMVTARPFWSPNEQKKLDQWMRNGGILINIRPSNADLGPIAPERIGKVQSQWVGFTDIPRFTLTTGKVLKASKNQNVVYQSSYGPEILVEPVGLGRRVLIADSLLNVNLSKHPEAAAVLAKIVGLYLREKPGMVWDEGFRLSEAASIRTTSPIPLEWYALLGQLLLISVLAAYTRGWRFGSPIPIESGSYMSLKDYLHSLASFYFKAGARVLVLEELTQDLRRRLAKTTGLSAGVGDDRLVQAYQNIYHHDAKPLEQLLRDCRKAIEEQKVGEKQLYNFGRLIDNFRRELDRYGIER